MDSANFTQKANDRSSKIVKFGDYFMVCCCLNLAGLMISSLFYSYWKFGYANPDILYQPARLILPWNQHCLLGWMAEGLYFIFVVAVGSFLAFKYLTLFISFLFFNIAFYQIFCFQFEKIDSLSQATSLQNYEIKRLFVETISFHISAKELFQQTARVYGSFIFIFLINTIITVSASVFQMDLALRHLDLAFFIMFYAFFYGLSQLYVYCYVGKESTDYFLAFAECLYESNWVALPFELRRSFPTMIVHAQRPLYYHGFYVVILDLDLFTRLMKTIASYYLMFKTFVDM